MQELNQLNSRRPAVISQLLTGGLGMGRAVHRAVFHSGAVALLLLLCSFSSALKAGATNASDTLIAEGRHVMGDRDSRSDAREFALLEAKKKVVEQAGTYIKSHTAVENYQLSEQEIESYSAALLRTEVLEERTEPVGETMAVIVKIRAIIDPAQMEEDLAALKNQESTGLEISELQEEYRRLSAQLDSLKNSPTVSEAVRPASREERWRQMEQLEWLIKLSAETNKPRPDLAYIELLSRRILEAFPNLDLVHGYIGIAAYKNGQIRRAITQLNQAIKKPQGVRRVNGRDKFPSSLLARIQREQALFHYFLARSYSEEGKKRLAKKHLEMAQKLAPQKKFPELK